MHAFLLLIITISFASNVQANWTPLEAGLELGTFDSPKLSDSSKDQLTLLRIDPNYWDLVLVGKSWSEGLQNQTAKEWCRQYGLTAAINAGMFGTDYTTHIGYLRSKEHVNNSHVNKYLSVAAFDPKPGGSQLPPFRIFDLDDTNISMDNILANFHSVVQNLRLIKRPGENRWKQQKRFWVEAALGEDDSGRILFIFSSSPLSMHDLNQHLLSLGIGLVAAQHLEGGPEAQLYIEYGKLSQEFFGGFNHAFLENDEESNSWPIPNVIGIRQRKNLLE